MRSVLARVRMTRPRRALAALMVAGVAIALSMTANVANAADSRLLCGSERWSVKTLQDKPKLLSVKATTIAFLISQPAPSSLPVTRLPLERRVYRVTASVTLVKQEADGDLHLVLRDGAAHMIAESPMPSCITGATAARQQQMSAARAATNVCAHAQIIGVVFFDFFHHQTGVAPNEIELHPILAFKCLTP